MIQKDNQTVGAQKKIIIYLFYLISILIIFMGFYFSVYSLINNISIPVLNTSVPGFVFGLLVSYLGLRYLFSVTDLKSELYQNSSRFSWSNFRKDRSNKRNKINYKGRNKL